jgi:hypothetical protein
MRKKHKLLSVAVAYLFILAQAVTPQLTYAAASGNYTDLLPIGAAGNTTVISNGSGWSLTTLAPSQTFGDALSRAPMTVYQSTGPATIHTTSAVSTFTAISGQGFVGSTTFPAAWVATGRSIRITGRGRYCTGATGPTWNWGVNIGTTTVLQTGAIAAPVDVDTHTFTASLLLTINATGTSGSISSAFDIFATTNSTSNGGINIVSYSTTTATAVTLDLTTQLSVNPFVQWGTSAAHNRITFSNVLVEFLN